MTSERPTLTGIVILDLTTGVAGAAATRFLAEVGALVLKVATSEVGNGTLSDAQFAALNRSKTHIAVDLTTEEGHTSLRNLVERAHVLVHDWSRDQIQDTGIAELIDASGRELIVANVTDYPHFHPDADRYGGELLVQARLGLMDEQQGSNGSPFFTRMPFANLGAAHLLAGGIAIRLFERLSGYKANSIGTSLMQAALLPASLYWQRAGRPPQWLVENTLKRDNVGAFLAVFECADGEYLQVHSGHTVRSDPGSPPPKSSSTGGAFNNSAPVREVLDALGWTDLAGVAVNVENRPRWAQVFMRKTRDEWLELLWAAECVVMPVLGPGQILQTEQARANNYVHEVEDPVFGRTFQSSGPYLVDPPQRISGPAPTEPARVSDILPVPTMKFQPDLASTPSPQDNRPLSGVRVLDFGSFVAGPLAGQFLADFGATVIKIEPPGGEKGRTINQFTACHRGKRSLALDLRNPASAPILARLVSTADVVLHNIRERSAKAMGIDEDSLRKINPNIIYAHSSAYGTAGPWADLPAFDATALALSGWTRAVAAEKNRPIWLRGSMMDTHTGVAVFTATVLGLIRRLRFGEPTRVGGSLLQTGVASFAEAFLIGDPAEPVTVEQVNDNELGLSPYCSAYRCTDGWVAIDASGPGDAQRLHDLLTESDAAKFADHIATFPSEEFVGKLSSVGIPHEVVRLNNRDLLFDQEIASGSRLVTREHTTPYGWFENPGGFWSEPEGAIRGTGGIPAVGEHTIEVLSEEGFTPTEIEDAINAGAIADLNQ